jgi:hypothetical protein
MWHRCKPGERQALAPAWHQLLPSTEAGSNVARFGPAAVGAATLDVNPGDPDTASDEADVAIDASLTDIQTTAGGD